MCMDTYIHRERGVGGGDTTRRHRKEGRMDGWSGNREREGGSKVATELGREGET